LLEDAQFKSEDSDLWVIGLCFPFLDHNTLAEVMARVGKKVELKKIGNVAM
jgi:hypothetical protein